MSDVFFFMALIVGIVGGFAIWGYSRSKQRGLIRSWRKQKEKVK